MTASAYRRRHSSHSSRARRRRPSNTHTPPIKSLRQRVRTVAAASEGQVFSARPWHRLARRFPHKVCHWSLHVDLVRTVGRIWISSDDNKPWRSIGSRVVIDGQIIFCTYGVLNTCRSSGRRRVRFGRIGPSGFRPRRTKWPKTLSLRLYKTGTCVWFGPRGLESVIRDRGPYCPVDGKGGDRTAFGTQIVWKRH